MKLHEWTSEKRGRAAKLARFLGVEPPVVSDWCTEVKQVPFERCVAVEQFTERLVTCEELRPDKMADFEYLRGRERTRRCDEQIQPNGSAGVRAEGLDAQGSELDRAMAQAARDGLIERRHQVRRAEDRKARASGRYTDHGV